MFAANRAISPRMHPPSHDRTGIRPSSMFRRPIVSPIGQRPLVPCISIAKLLTVSVIDMSPFAFNFSRTLLAFDPTDSGRYAACNDQPEQAQNHDESRTCDPQS